MKTKKWITGILLGCIAGLVVASIMTFLDWRLNPSGIFHSEEHGTDWSNVWETWRSWFLPVAWPVAAIALVILFLIEKIRKYMSCK